MRVRKYKSLLGLLALLGLLLLLRAWDTTLADDDVLEDVVELSVLADGGQDVVRDESLGGLVILAGVGLLEDLLDDLLEHGGHEDRRVRGDALGEAALLQVAVDTTHREDDACAGGSGLGFLVDSH